MIGLRFRKRDTPPQWEIKVTTPDGTVVDIDTEALYIVWKYGGNRTNDGYVDLLEMPRLHLWVKPAGWVEPDRSASLDGTAALPERYRR